MQSSDPGMERDIVENVAGYGRQLGRISEALRVLLDHEAVRAAALSPEERKAIDDFTDMSDQIADLKAKREQLTARQVDEFVDTLAQLREKNPEGYRRVAERLRAALG
jgi:ABC-type transporter Mla subunit MlaD